MACCGGKSNRRRRGRSRRRVLKGTASPRKRLLQGRRKRLA